jgi:hypothetical protein
MTKECLTSRGQFVSFHFAPGRLVKRIAAKLFSSKVFAFAHFLAGAFRETNCGTPRLALNFSPSFGSQGTIGIRICVGSH